MRYSDVITLISLGDERNSSGYQKGEEKRTEVYADRKSVTRSEFYGALSTGRKIAAIFRLRSCEYDGQQLVEHMDGTMLVRYKVIREFRTNPDFVELSCEEVKRSAIGR